MSARMSTPSWRTTKIISLQIEIERLDDGTWMLDAPWLDAALHGPDWQDLYWEAKRLWQIKNDTKSAGG